MALRTAHGKGAPALLRAETVPVDELPEGVPAPAKPPAAAGRDGKGKFGPGNPHAAAGGRAKARKMRLRAELADRLGLVDLPADSAFAGYVEHAAEFAAVELRRLAELVGGGEVGPGPASMVQSAALALAASRYMYSLGAQTGDGNLLGRAAMLADKSRQGLLTAHELVAREAQARARQAPPIDLAKLLAEDNS